MVGAAAAETRYLSASARLLTEQVQKNLNLTLAQTHRVEGVGVHSEAPPLPFHCERSQLERESEGRGARQTTRGAEAMAEAQAAIWKLHNLRYIDILPLYTPNM